MRPGGCQCGAVRFTVSKDKLFCYACHCSQCQKQSASAFGLSVPVRQAQFKVEGTLNYWSRSTFSGGRTDCYFCPDCGSPLYTLPPLHPDRVFIKAGSLDDPTLVAPSREAWTTSRVSWAEIAPGLTRYEKGRV